MKGAASGAAVLLTVSLLLSVACEPRTPTSTYASAVPTSPSRFIYAAQADGIIQVYDMDHSHQLVKRIEAFSCCADVRGAAAAPPPHPPFLMYNRENKGHVVGL